MLFETVMTMLVMWSMDMQEEEDEEGGVAITATVAAEETRVMDRWRGFFFDIPRCVP